MAASQKAAAALRTIEHTTLFQLARQRFGPDPWTWAFQCPGCGHVATGRSFPPEHAEQVSVACARMYQDPQGCTRMANDEQSPGPWRVLMQDGTSLWCFALAPPRITLPEGPEAARPSGAEQEAACSS
jgi:hypothetical protein